MEINLFMLLGIILVALIVQYAIEAIKVITRAVCKIGGNDSKQANAILAPILSAGLAVFLCILAGLDFFAAFGYPLSVVYVGSIVTGIIASLGAGKVYDLILDVKDYRDKLAVEKAKEVGE